MNGTYEERFRLCTWDVDQAGKLTMAAAYNYFQEVAGNHAAALGVGAEYMQENGIVWILSRMSAVLDSRPLAGSRVTVRTWPRGTDRLFAVRDYELLDAAGAVVGRGRSGWLVVDTQSFRPRRPDAVVAGLPKNEDLDSMPDGALAVPTTEGLEARASRAVAYSDLDVNGHMNNARYVQWIQDTMEPDALASATALRLDINYLAEMKPGPAATILSRTLEANSSWTARHAFEGRLAPDDRSPDGQTAFRAELSIR
jgi:medium-chain acyl-[acyl-carrier-protein] hydrolase